MKNEIGSLTGLRGIAALYVMTFHYMREVLINKYAETPSAFILYLKNIISHGYLGVDVFFMLSAFVLTLRYRNTFSEKVDFHNYMNFMKKRFQRLYLTYLVAVIVAMLIIRSYSPIVFFIEAFFIQVFTDVNLYNFNIATWSLSVEWFIYLIFPFFLLVVQKFSKLLSFVVFLLAIWLLYYIQFLETFVYSIKNFSIMSIKPAYNLNIHFGFLALFRALAVYYLGFMVFRYHRSFNKKVFFMLSVIAIILAIINNYNDVFIVFAFMFFFAGILKENVISKFFQSTLVHYLGKISYSLYLFHLIVFNTMNKFMWIDFKSNTTVFIIVSMTISLLIAAFSYEILEKRLSKVLYNRSY